MALTFDEKIAIAKLKAEGLAPYAIAKRLGSRKYDINYLTKAKGYGILMANNKLPFGLCKKYHIPLPDDATPKDAWEALKKNGIEYFEQEESEIVNPADFLGDDEEFDERNRYTSKKTVLLPRSEYSRLVSALGSKLAGKKQIPRIIRIHLSNYSYTVEVYGYGNYRVIEKEQLK